MAAAVGNPRLISFAAGLVDYHSLPVEAVSKAASEVLAVAGPAALQYGTTSGDATLRRLLLEHLCRLEGVSADELSLTPENVIITTGSQQGLYLLSDVLLDEGDIAITADPSYFVYTGLLQSLGVDVRTVPMDEGGIRVDALARLMDDLEAQGELPKLKLVYVQSYYQNPTGLTLAPDRRQPLADLVRRAGERAGHRVVLLEDAAYRELAYDGPADLPSLKRFDPENRFVASSYTFSKPLAPGLKTGYLFLPDGLADPILQQKGNHDFGSPNLCQALLAKLVADGTYAEHVERLKTAYRERRELMLDALEAELGDVEGVSWTRPTGGLYVWLTLPRLVDTGRDGPLFRACLDENVLYVPGGFCHWPDADGNVANHEIRLCYGVVPKDRIAEGIRRLANAVRQTMRQANALRHSA